MSLFASVKIYNLDLLKGLGRVRGHSPRFTLKEAVGRCRRQFSRTTPLPLWD